MADVPGLATLARLYGVQTSFHDVDGCRRDASPEALLAVLRALGAPVESAGGVSAALRERRRTLWARRLEPVTVAWQDGPSSAGLRLPAAAGDRTFECELTLEDGGVRRWPSRPGEREDVEVAEMGGERFRLQRLGLPADLSEGYHRLAVEVSGERVDSLVIAAPSRSYRQPGARRSWGVFLPLYALRSERNWGAGDFGDLRSLMEWVVKLGGDVVSTLPLLATFLDEPLEPSPYVPASRLFWNEVYLDVEAVPELAECEPARKLVGSAAFRREVERLRRRPLVDHRALASLKRSVLERLAGSFFAGESRRRDEFERFLEPHPEVSEYARFRAVTERRRAPWNAWPRLLRDGALGPEEYDQDNERYHLYVQWLAHEQLADVADRARASSAALHLDMPLGTHPDGYDVWRERELFAWGISAGAPPDTFFPSGQDWGFRPPEPEAQRRQGYRYFRACLVHHLRFAGSLRLDHVMGLHRLYWIPRDGGSREGVYVRYPHEELYAVLCLESHRHEAEIVGEDLGTVPQSVRRSMSKHGLTRSYVLQIEPTVNSERPFGRIPKESVASLNTHDTSTFAAFWSGVDTKLKRKLGALSPQGAKAERRSRRWHKKQLVTFLKRRSLLRGDLTEDAAALRGCLAYLGASRARTVLVALEDLWLETESQNVPGTNDEHPNWRRKARYAEEEFRNASECVQILRDVDSHRKGKGRVAAE